MNKWTKEECEAIVARIRQNFDYDPDRGLLVCRQTGKVVNGYRRSIRNGVGRYMGFDLRIDGHRFVMCYHRAVWAWHHGRLPTMQIDHVNHDTFDNHIENLREVTQSENKLNSAQPWQSGSGGLPGVLCDKGSYRIRVKRKRYSSRDPYHLFYHLTLLGRRFK
jgi:hypothetical protein